MKTKSKSLLSKLRIKALASITPEERLGLQCFGLLEEELDRKIAELLKADSAI